jgi:hypothetical protein
MPEHRIRLRGGWECHARESDDEDAPEVVRRIDLPAASAAELPARFRLTRQFGRPPVDLRNEIVSLEMRGVPGLKATRINGRAIELGLTEDAACSIDLSEPLLPRNGLVLEVELVGLPRSEGVPWGEIALVIRPR